jgi:hypothetical protein
MDRQAVLRWAAVAAALFGLSGCARLGGEAFQPTHSLDIPFTGSLDTPIGQTFRPATKAIAEIDLLTVTYAQLADPRGALTVTLADGLGGRQLARVVVNGAQVEDNHWLPVRFDPPVLAPEVSAITVRWHGTAPVGLLANAPPPGFDRTAQAVNDPYPGGQLTISGMPAAGDLAFRVVGTGGAGAAARQLVGMARSAGGRLLRDELGFTLGWLGLLIGAMALAITGLRQRTNLACQLDDGGDGEQEGERDQAGA